MPRDQQFRTLAEWESATIEVFVRAVDLIGFPRSVGEIYGLLFCAQEPVSFDDLVERLKISKGSVSQGLKLLRQLGAVRVHYIAGSRKDHYEPELSMKRLVQGFIRDQFRPHIESGNERLDQIERLIEQVADSGARRHAIQRLDTLRVWHKRTRKLVPIIFAVLGGAARLSPTSPKYQEEGVI